MTAHRIFGRVWSLLALALAGGLAVCGSAAAQGVPGYPARYDAFDPREVAMLPRYCIYTQIFRDRVPGGNDPVVGGRWQNEFGANFDHVHHYCFGLMKTNRGLFLARERKWQEYYLNEANIEYDYVLDRTADDFVLRPEVLTKKGENLMRLNQEPLAVFDFERAIQLKEDYWPAYAQLSDYYKVKGNKAKAREYLETGLARSPDAQALRRRLAEIDPAARRTPTKN